MKKLVLLALGLVFMGLLSLSSCSKECKCTMKETDSPDITVEIVPEDGKKCKDYNESVTEGDYSYSVTCK